MKIQVGTYFRAINNREITRLKYKDFIVLEWLPEKNAFITVAIDTDDSAYPLYFTLDSEDKIVTHFVNSGLHEVCPIRSTEVMREILRGKYDLDNELKEWKEHREDDL